MLSGLYTTLNRWELIDGNLGTSPLGNLATYRWEDGNLGTWELGNL